MDNTIADELNLLRNTKKEIATAITEMGVEVPESLPFSGYPDLIRELNVTHIPPVGGDWGVIYLSSDAMGDNYAYTIPDEESYNRLASNATTGYYSMTDGTQIDQSIISAFSFGRKTKSVGNHFLALVKNITAIYHTENLETIGDFFCSSCQNLNCPLKLENIRTIGNNFLYGAQTFNSQITLGPQLTSIGTNFLGESPAFSQPLSIPSSVRSIGLLEFMNDKPRFVGPLEVNCPVSALGTLMYNCLTLLKPTKSCTDIGYTQGIKLTGKYAEEWKAALPDLNGVKNSSTTNPKYFYRKLILGSQ